MVRVETFTGDVLVFLVLFDPYKIHKHGLVIEVPPAWPNEMRLWFESEVKKYSALIGGPVKGSKPWWL
jgi:hypothetical protein